MINSYNSLKKYYINLDHRFDRKEAMEKQIGDSFIRVPAYFGKEKTKEEVEEVFDFEKALKRYERAHTVSQASCTISHWQIYQNVLADQSIQEDDWVFIAEDDNLFVADFPQRLEQCLEFLNQERFNEVDFVNLHYFDQKDFFSVKGELLYYIKTKKVAFRDSRLEKLLGDGFFKWGALVANSNQFYSFKYKNLPNCYDPALNPENEQSFYLANRRIAFSSTCYLVKKRALRILETLDKPYWVTDDFNAFVPATKILTAMPPLAINDEETYTSDISYSGMENVDSEIKKENLTGSEHHKAFTDFDEAYENFTVRNMPELGNLYSEDASEREKVKTKLAKEHYDLSNIEFDRLQAQGKITPDFCQKVKNWRKFSLGQKIYARSIRLSYKLGFYKL